MQDFCIRVLPLKAHQIIWKAALERSECIKRRLWIQLETAWHWPVVSTTFPPPFWIALQYKAVKTPTQGQSPLVPSRRELPLGSISCSCDQLHSSQECTPSVCITLCEGQYWNIICTQDTQSTSNWRGKQEPFYMVATLDLTSSHKSHVWTTAALNFLDYSYTLANAWPTHTFYLSMKEPSNSPNWTHIVGTFRG